MTKTEIIVKIAAAIVSIAGAMAGCTEDINLSLGHDATKLVVNGHLCDKKSDFNFVQLSLSTDYFSNCDAPSVSGARVTVDDGTETYTFGESTDKPGYYMAPEGFICQQGESYTLNITDVDTDNDGENETYTATQQMPPTYTIDSVQCYKNKYLDMYQIALFAPEDVTTKNYYMFGFTYKDSLVTDTFLKFDSCDDELFANEYCWGATIYTFNQDIIKSGKIAKGDDITVHILSINEEFYKYDLAVDDIFEGSTPMFSSAPANAVGNISNGALGFFTVFAVVEAKCKIK